MSKSKQTKKSTAKSRRVSVPAGSECYIFTPGQGLPPGLQERVDKIVENELKLALEKGEEAQRNRPAVAMTTDQIVEKVMGYINGASADTQNKVIAIVIDRVRYLQVRHLDDCQRHCDHVIEQRDLAQRSLLDLDRIKSGDIMIIR